MNYGQAFKELEKIVKKEKIKLVLKTLSLPPKAKGLDICIGGLILVWDDDFQFITQNIIELQSTCFGIMIVSLLHELGHYFQHQTKSLSQVREIWLQRNNNEKFGVLEDEIIAWSKGWDIAIRLGLNKNKRFVKKFEAYKAKCLSTYLYNFLEERFKKETK